MRRISIVVAIAASGCITHQTSKVGPFVKDIAGHCDVVGVASTGGAGGPSSVGVARTSAGGAAGVPSLAGVGAGAPSVGCAGGAGSVGCAGGADSVGCAGGAGFVLAAGTRRRAGRRGRFGGVPTRLSCAGVTAVSTGCGAAFVASVTGATDSATPASGTPATLAPVGSTAV